MRGALFIFVFWAKLMRITPAYAGSTDAKAARASVAADHPRICGEHKVSRRVDTPTQGSPPHMRGALPPRSGWHQSLRITPAYAGSTSTNSRSNSNVSDHPRICGEHGMLRGKNVVLLGSPPHMRGAPDKEFKEKFSAGITPAYAGSTSSPISCTNFLKDHPRICGEHQGGGGVSIPGRGSPPHMRGAL